MSFEIIHYYNRLNGNSISLDKLKGFRARVEKHIDSHGTGPHMTDLKGILQRVSKAIKNIIAQGAEGAERVVLVPIDVKKTDGKILRVASGYEDKPEVIEPAKAVTNTSVKEIPLSSIHTDTKRFQNRVDSFSEASANNVALHFDANKFDPIVVWKDPKNKTTYVLSGHSRYEGMKRRKAKTIPVRYFTGSEEEAIKFARVEANRSANQESLVEDLAAYKMMRDGKEGVKPATKTELNRIFKGKVGKLEAYSFLNTNGLFLQSLSQSNTSNYPYLERNAQWVGIIRNQFPVISHTGEDNIFHFFYSDKSGRNIKASKDDFFALVKKKVNQLRKDESVLFPECSSDGCKQTVDREADPQKGEAFKRLREINEALDSIREKLTSKDATVRVTTDEEKKYLRATAEKLEEEKQRINRDLDLIDKSQVSLFGFDKEEYIKDLKHINSLKEKRNKIPAKFPNKKANHQAEIDKLEIAFELKYRNGLFIKKYPHLYGFECGCPEEEQVTGLGFTKDGQGKIYDMITDMVLDTMKKDGLFWRKKWDSGKVPSARNYPTERGYRGANWVMLTLMANMNFGYSSPFFMTFNSIKKNGGTLRKKSQSWPVVFYNRIYQLDGKKITEDQYNALPKKVQEDVQVFPFLQYYSVFNGQDVEGIDFPETKYQQRIKSRTEFERLESAEAIVQNMPNRPDIDHGNRTAHFLPGDDKIDMPDKRAFDNAQDYYSVLFHELIHSTGHKSRLNRVMKGDKDTKEYAFEELVAEFGASYLCAEAGILYHTVNDSAVYVKHYGEQLESILKDDNKFFLKAAAAAQKAADYILNKVEEPVLAGPQYDAFDIQPKKKHKGPLNPLQMAQLQDAIKAGRTPKVNLKAKMNAKEKPAPLFDEPVNNPKQASLFGVSASSLAGMEFKTLPFDGKWKTHFGTPSENFSAMVWGKPKQGKTHYSFQLANYVSQFGTVLYVLSDEGIGYTVKEKIIANGLDKNEKVSFIESRDVKEIENAIKSGQYKFVFIDLIGNVRNGEEPLSADDFYNLRKRHAQVSFIPVFASTKTGNFKGAQDWSHDVDMMVEVEAGKASAQGRFGGGEYEIFKKSNPKNDEPK